MAFLGTGKRLGLWAHVGLMALVASCTGRERVTYDQQPQPAPSGQSGQENPQTAGQPGAQQPGAQQPGEQGSGPDSGSQPPADNSQGSQNPDTVDPVTDDSGSSEPPPTDNSATQPAGPNPSGTYEIKGAKILLQDMTFDVPGGWALHQDAFHEGTIILGFSQGDSYFRIYVRKDNAPALSSFVTGASERSEDIAGRTWKRADSSKGSVSVAAFSTVHQGHTYYGFGRAGSADAARQAMTAFLSGMR